jgi:hypothetical protein
MFDATCIFKTKNYRSLTDTQNLTHRKLLVNKGNNKITELRTMLQRESQNS